MALTLLVGKVSYIFDFEDVQSGRLPIESRSPKNLDLEVTRMDIGDVSLESEVCVWPGNGQRVLMFYVQDAEKHQLSVRAEWIES